MTTSRATDLLWGGAVLFALIAVALGVWPVSSRVPNVPGAMAARPPASAAATNVDDATVRVDVFAAGHIPPRTRWTPPAVDTMPLGLAPDPAAAAALAAGQTDAPDPPRFYGTVTDSRGIAALIRLPNAADARLFHVGDGARGWRIVAVTPERATVVGPDGVRTSLRLPRAAP